MNEFELTKHNFQPMLLNWYSKHGRKALSWRESPDSYKMLIAEILLRRTRVEQVEPVYKKIINKYPNVGCLAKANLLSLQKIIETIGLKNKANRLIEISQIILKKYNGIIPNNEIDLQSFNGIGPYISNSILTFGYRLKKPIVDGNVFRIYNRIFNMKKSRYNNNDKKMWQIAKVMLPDENYCEYNAALLDFGALICTYKNPKCKQCFFKKFCSFSKLNFK